MLDWLKLFQHTAARRRLNDGEELPPEDAEVSTHSRPKAAEREAGNGARMIKVFQHTAARRRLIADRDNQLARLMFQHTAARRRLNDDLYQDPKPSYVSTHSRPKAADAHSPVLLGLIERFQHTAARRRLTDGTLKASDSETFQHTAARRRLRGIWRL